MEIKDILKNLREKNNLTQEQLAERVQVTRQAVSRWETGETQPNTDTLKLLSRVFDVSINTLLGSPRKLVCQCCGMPLNEDGLISREQDGTYNEDYCKWCYIDGNFIYQSKESLLDYLVVNMPNPDNTDEETRRNQFDLHLSQLKHWK
ncbi:MAG TPA: helix-turn-helix domain-containing protein [Firmicutes bacterium]|nr:helix-turn-helix domain-containing protein [Bacillota bacterium]